MQVLSESPVLRVLSWYCHWEGWGCSNLIGKHLLNPHTQTKFPRCFHCPGENGVFLRVTGVVSPLAEPSASRAVPPTLVSPVPAWELQPGLSCVAAAVQQMPWGSTAFTPPAWPLSLVLCLVGRCCPGQVGRAGAGSSAAVIDVAPMEPCCSVLPEDVALGPARICGVLHAARSARGEILTNQTQGCRAEHWNRPMSAAKAQAC